MTRCADDPIVEQMETIVAREVIAARSRDVSKESREPITQENFGHVLLPMTEYCGVLSQNRSVGERAC